VNGTRGPSGIHGPQGLKGEKGETGSVGPKGQDGLDGRDGSKGNKGNKGERGEVSLLLYIQCMCVAFAAIITCVIISHGTCRSGLKQTLDWLLLVTIGFADA